VARRQLPVLGESSVSAFDTGSAERVRRLVAFGGAHEIRVRIEDELVTAGL